MRCLFTPPPKYPSPAARAARRTHPLPPTLPLRRGGLTPSYPPFPCGAEEAPPPTHPSPAARRKHLLPPTLPLRRGGLTPSHPPFPCGAEEAPPPTHPFPAARRTHPLPPTLPLQRGGSTPSHPPFPCGAEDSPPPTHPSPAARRKHLLPTHPSPAARRKHPLPPIHASVLQIWHWPDARAAGAEPECVLSVAVQASLLLRAGNVVVTDVEERGRLALWTLERQVCGVGVGQGRVGGGVAERFVFGCDGRSGSAQRGFSRAAPDPPPPFSDPPPRPCFRGRALRKNFFVFLFIKDSPQGPPAADCQPLPTANLHQPPPSANHQPPTATNRQLPTANRHPAPTANRHPPPTANRQPPPTATHRHPAPTANRHQPLPTANHCSIPHLRSCISPVS